MIKQELLNKILAKLDKKIGLSKVSIQNLQDSRENETKSSAGDKYETAREMVQQELDKNRMQLHRLEKTSLELIKIETDKKLETIDFGAIVFTNNNNYFISSALGKVVYEDQFFYCISLVSPLGKALTRRCSGDTFDFQQQHFEILRIE